MFQEGLSCYLGLNSGRSVSIKVNKTRKYFSRNIHGARMFPQCFPCSFQYGKHCFQCQFLYSRCEVCLRYMAGNFNENPSMQARPSEHSSNFGEQFERRPNFASTFKLNGTIRYPYQSELELTDEVISMTGTTLISVSVC